MLTMTSSWRYFYGDLQEDVDFTTLLLKPYGAEQPIFLIIQAGSEEKRIRITRIGSIAKRNGPESFIDNRVSLLVAQCTEKFPSVMVVGIDPAIPEVANEQGIAERTKIVGRERQSPRRVQLTARDKPL